MESPHNDWKNLTAEELRIGAKVARAHGGMILPAAADSWEARADLMDLEAQYPLRFVYGLDQSTEVTYTINVASEDGVISREEDRAALSWGR